MLFAFKISTKFMFSKKKNKGDPYVREIAGVDREMARVDREMTRVDRENAGLTVKSRPPIFLDLLLKQLAC